MTEVISLFLIMEIIFIVLLVLAVLIFLKKPANSGSNVTRDVQKIKEQIMGL